ncbi:MAG: hydrolase [Ignavibacteria bacterium GWB2_35_12]|nr:MAG: hydrolase [Ignavibacteria bacterium GWA2_35_8]OGU40040.1 MAG: hydrolase [Ignavibacteria bacterium GWB2_35_12]OGU86952.1 MAG: hydrolase [Ignavibacteria bacterium RIFOXYA2_FULL_35_10]OGV21995.1 MAG: hydrolase [Ignavibacteria bacterium RIFOXYC2_FULL_35_21]
MTKIIFLGTGTPNPDPEHSGISVLLLINNTPYIFDCGPGLVRNASKLNPKYGGKFKGFDVKNLNHVFITHLHSDHTVGYPDLIFTPWVMGRDVPLEAYGPTGLKSMTNNILEAYDEDINVRLHGLEQANDRGWRVNVTEFKEGVFYKDSNITVEAFQVEHGNWEESYGFLVITPDKRIVISGDCRPNKKLIEKGKGADILIHEVYSAEKLKTREAKWQKYHPQYHTSTYELGEIASQINPSLLLLYHQLYWGDSDNDLLNQIKTKWNGNVISAQDMSIY